MPDGVRAWHRLADGDDAGDGAEARRGGVRRGRPNSAEHLEHTRLEHPDGDPPVDARRCREGTATAAPGFRFRCVSCCVP